ncbi:polysaccharide biosynthesis protein [Pararhizobium mangrovi]|uniref:polysaccharide biosynthesis protein n=1 Tax=Pararhizobium mangrovi TaxID=2590452 RepID=UPI001F3354AE|nr:nucleoside-diphosphate sugar epimerase/dehydratase [Pararhizobium mangrovi]
MGLTRARFRAARRRGKSDDGGIGPLRGLLRGLPRPAKRVLLIGSDIVLLLLVLETSFSLRLGNVFVPSNDQLALMLAAPVIAIPIFVRLGLYRAVIRYLPDRAIWVTVQAMSLATLLWVCLLFLTSMSGLEGAPRSIPLFYWVFGIWAVAGSRFAAKALLWPSGTAIKRLIRRQVLIYGTDAASLQLAAALHRQADRFVAGFIDPDGTLRGRDVMGIRVYSESSISDLIRNYGIKEIFVSLPSVDQERRKRLLSELHEHPVKIRVLPAISDFASGKGLQGQLRDLEIDDLLGRSAVPPEPSLLAGMIEDRAILVTGAAGSIGSEVVRLVARWKPRRLVLLDINEYGLYQLEQSLKRMGVEDAVYMLGSVADESMVRNLLERHAIAVVFHAAAYKHVPLVENNVLAGVRNNVLGTLAVARQAHQCGVENFVLISTDKAVRPSNVMGASKRWAELITRHFGEKATLAGTGQKFCAVRFGNVLGSSGSVVPLFREQIEAGGPITLTDEGMMRYFMSIHEAAELIVQAGALSEGGDIFLLDMGEQVRIRKLAENMIRLAGFMEKSAENPEGDIEIRVVGKRSGEKLVEELFYDPNTAIPTTHPKILRARRPNAAGNVVETELECLRQLVDEGDETRIRQRLMDFLKL